MCILTDLHDKVSLGGYRRQTCHSHYVKSTPHSYFQSIPKSVIFNDVLIRCLSPTVIYSQSVSSKGSLNLI